LPWPTRPTVDHRVVAPRGVAEAPDPPDRRERPSLQHPGAEPTGRLRAAVKVPRTEWLSVEP